MAIEPLPINFRSELLPEIYKHLRAGKCGTLIGVANSGKSRLVEFLGRADVRRNYLSDDWDKVLFVWVDGNDLLEYSEWGLYEKIIRALRNDLERIPNQEETLEQFYEYYDELIALSPEKRLLARRVAEDAIDQLQGIKRIVLLLDDFEEFLLNAGDIVYRGLRAFRDHYKRDYHYKVLYLLFSRVHPVDIHNPPSPAYEAFIELFKNFAMPIGCYGKEDAMQMIDRLAGIYELEGGPLNKAMAQELYEVTGGHAGLIDAAFHSKTDKLWSRAGLAKALINSPSVHDECASIMDGLNSEHISVLRSLANGDIPNPAETLWLKQSGLVKQNAEGVPYIIKLLHLYISNGLNNSPKIRFVTDEQGNPQVIIDDCILSNMRPKELEVFRRLYESFGEYSSKADLVGQTGLEVREVDRIIQQLRIKLKNCHGNLINIRRHDVRGYRMI